MGARLLCKRGKLKGAEFAVEADTTIGRSRTNSVVLEAAGVSGSHARIAWSGERGRYELEDLDSTNGTLLDGVLATGSEPLGRLHVITFGRRHSFIFAWDGHAPAGHAPAGHESAGEEDE